MSESARVTELQALADLQAGLCIFQAEGKEALAAVEFEIRRMLEWLDDQKQFWQRTVREREEDVTQAKADLARRKTFKLFDQTPDCTEQEKALRLALHRLDEAETKLANCRRWIPLLQREIEEYQGPARRLAGLLEGTLPRAVALLERMRGALDAYLQVAPPAGGERGETSP
jgi:hypothetical protein